MPRQSSGARTAPPPSELWDCDPRQVFRDLVDHLSLSLNIVAALYHEARVRRPRTSAGDCPIDDGADAIDIGPLIESIDREAIEHIRPDLRDQLGRAVIAAQGLWCDTPVREYIDGSSVVHLGGKCGPAASHHELAMIVASEAYRLLTVSGLPAVVWMDDLRSAVGDGVDVVDRLNEVAAHVRVESQIGIERLVEKVRPKEAKKTKVSSDEANKRVREYLTKHAKGNPQAIRIREVAKAIGASVGLVSKTPSWQAFERHRKAISPSSPRTIPLTDKMRACIPDQVVGNPAEIALEKLMREQEEDWQADVRPQKRRRA